VDEDNALNLNIIANIETRIQHKLVEKLEGLNPENFKPLFAFCQFAY